MALILNKATTGVTSIDISGNTLTTGYTHLLYNDEYGNTHENPYLVVDNVIIDKNRHFCKIETSIYKNLSTRESDKTPVFKRSYLNDFDVDLYNEYFSLSIMENVNIFEASYNFLSNIYFIGWKSDE